MDGPSLVSWHDEVRRVVGTITCPGFAFALDQRDDLLVLEVVATDRDDRRGRPWLIYGGMGEAAIVRTAFLAVQDLAADAIRERFLVDGAAIYSDQDIGGAIELARRTAAFSAAVEQAKRRLARMSPEERAGLFSDRRLG